MAAIIAGEFEGARVGELPPELIEAVGVCAAESVDQLVLIAHHADISVRLGQSEENALLGAVGVLVFVHQQVADGAAIARGHLGIFEHSVSVGLQAGEVDEPPLFQTPQVALVASAEGFTERMPGGNQLLRVDELVGDAVEAAPASLTMRSGSDQPC